MADSFTAKLNLTKPEVGASTDTWGTKLNADLDTIDGLFDTGPYLKIAKGGTGAGTAADARTGLGLGSSDSPQFAGVNIGNASDSTITRVSTATLAIEGDTILTATASATVTSKRIQKRVTSEANPASITPSPATQDVYIVTGQAQTLTINSPTGTPVQGETLIIRIKDNGTSRSLSWNAIFRAIGTALPSATTAGKTTYVGAIYNSTDTKWDVVAVGTET